MVGLRILIPSVVVRIHHPQPSTIYGAFVYRLGHQVFILVRAVRLRYALPCYRGMEKWLTRQPHKLEIAGSNPASATNTHRYQSGLMATPAKRVIRWFKSSPVLHIAALWWNW